MSHSPRSTRVFHLALALAPLSAACGDDAPGHDNPRQLWLALDGSETQVRLVAAEPTPF
ncbi:MAG: hypothetical protein KA190_25535 [Kofleriaceae bacterium]|jgi:hypothetical protein|nr:hypothetical protein [Kofleriaceae bacterium]